MEAVVSDRFCPEDHLVFPGSQDLQDHRVKKEPSVLRVFQ